MSSMTLPDRSVRAQEYKVGKFEASSGRTDRKKLDSPMKGKTTVVLLLSTEVASSPVQLVDTPYTVEREPKLQANRTATNMTAIASATKILRFLVMVEDASASSGPVDKASSGYHKYK